MPEAIVSRIVRLAGYGVYRWEAEDATGVLRLSIPSRTPTWLGRKNLMGRAPCRRVESSGYAIAP
jgi:hypothetical protein